VSSQRVRAEPDRQTVPVHSEVENRPLLIGDSRVEEVHRRRTSITSHKVDQNVGSVGHPILNFSCVRRSTVAVPLAGGEACYRQTFSVNAAHVAASVVSSATSC